MPFYEGIETMVTSVKASDLVKGGGGGMEIANFVSCMSGTGKPFSTQHLSNWIVETIEFTNTSMGLYSPMGLGAIL